MPAATIELPDADPSAQIRAIPLVANGTGAVLRPAVCLFVQGERPVLKTQILDGSVVHEGCLVDIDGRIIEALDIIIESVDSGTESAPPPASQPGSATAIHSRWTHYVEAMTRLHGPMVIRSGWEQFTPLPLWIDPVAAAVATIAGWTLCTDNQALQNAGLPSFAGSAARYLWNPSGQPGYFAPLTAESPSPHQSVEVETLLPEARSLVAVNPTCGGMLFVRRPRGSMSLGDYARVLSGRLPEDAVGWIRVPRQNTVSQDMTLTSRLSLRERAIEILHLKLAAIHDAATAAAAEMRATRMPLLNVGPERFRVNLLQPGGALPLLWTARVELSQPGCAVEVRSGDGRLLGFRVGNQLPAVAGPSAAGPQWSDRTELTIIELTPQPESDHVMLMGTLIARDIDPSPHDIVTLRLTLDGEAMTIAGSVERTRTQGYWKFKSDAFRPRASLLQRWTSRAGMLKATVQRIQQFPVQTPLADLEQMGYLAAWLLLGNEANSGAHVANALHLLAAQTDRADGARHASIVGCIKDDPALHTTLGSGNLFSPPISDSIISDSLWSHCLDALLVAITASSEVASPPLAADVLDRFIGQISEILLRTRALLGRDHRSNALMRRAIASLGTSQPKKL